MKDVSEEQTKGIAHGVGEYVERAASHRKSLQRRNDQAPGQPPLGDS